MTHELEIDITRDLPSVSGVYAIRGGRHGREELVQLDETGRWWPYPYMFSGWRPGELRAMGGSWYHLTNRPIDVPEIRDPELRDGIEAFTQELLTAFPEIDYGRIAAFAKRHMMDRFG